MWREKFSIAVCPKPSSRKQITLRTLTSKRLFAFLQSILLLEKIFTHSPHLHFITICWQRPTFFFVSTLTDRPDELPHPLHSVFNNSTIRVSVDVFMMKLKSKIFGLFSFVSLDCSPWISTLFWTGSDDDEVDSPSTGTGSCVWVSPVWSGLKPNLLVHLVLVRRLLLLSEFPMKNRYK